MVRLPKADLDGLTPEKITELLIANIRGAEVNGAVLGQIVENVSRETWSLVDLQRVRAAASTALHYDVTVKHARTAQERGDEHRGLNEVDAVLNERADALLGENERESALQLARSLLSKEMARIEADPTGEAAESAGTARKAKPSAGAGPVTDDAGTPDIEAAPVAEDAIVGGNQ